MTGAQIYWLVLIVINAVTLPINLHAAFNDGPWIGAVCSIVGLTMSILFLALAIET